MLVYILVQNERQYTNDDCRNLGVYADHEVAKRAGWGFLIDQVLRPWTLERYQQKKEHVGVSDFYVETWDVSQSKQHSTCRLGWTVVPPYHKSLIDKYLKELVCMGVNLEDRLVEWKKHLDDGVTPEELAALED